MESEDHLGAGNVNANGRIANQRALEFADAAADAPVSINMRQLHGDG